MTDLIEAVSGLQVRAQGQARDSVLLGLLEDVRAVLLDAGIEAEIFTGWTPPAPDTCLSLFEYAGDPPRTLARLEAPGLQVLARQAEGDNDYQKCRMLAVSVLAALHDLKNFTKNRTLYIHITANQSPFSLGRDELNRPVFCVNFIVKMFSI